MEIAATMPVERGADGWIVPSQSGPGTYLVVPHPTTTRQVALGLVPPPTTNQPWSCTCPDFELRGQPCKHVIAVEYVIRRETHHSDGSVVTEEVKVTYSQPWAAYNAAQMGEKRTFLPMLKDLCGTLSRPQKRRGRPAMPLSDMAFLCVSKVYSGFSGRRYSTDVEEAAEDGFTDVDPHFNTVLRYLRDPAMTPILAGLVRLSALPLAGVEQDFAADSTGFSTCNYARWYDHKWGKEQVKREWVKLHAMTGVLTNVVTSVEVTGRGTHDSPLFRPLLAETAENFTIREVSADKAYSSKANLQAVDDLGATPFIPFKASPVGPVPAIHSTELFPGITTTAPDSAWARMRHYFMYQRDTFLSHYHKRSNAETTFWMIKSKFGESLRSKSEIGQFNEVLCKVIAHNLVCVIHAMHELGLATPTFGPAVAR